MKQYREITRRGTENFPFAHYKQRLTSHMIQLHWHPEIELIYGIEGETDVTVAEEKCILKPGDILFINPEELHSYTPHTAEVLYHAAVFDISLFQFRESHFFEQSFTIPILNGTLRFPRMIQKEHPQYDIICPIVHDMFHRDIDSKSMIFADLTLLFSILLENALFDKTPKKASYERADDIKMCINYMEEHCSEKLALTQLSDLVHMSPNYFCSYFKAQTGVSAFTQLNYIRVKRAAKLLSESTDSIMNIAENCGYENVSFFIRKFKEIQGCTPSVYRKNHLS